MKLTNSMTQHRILIVEDDRSLTGVLEYNLAQNDYQVLTARDGQEGLTRARADQPDLILLDVMLPRADGLDVCRALRAGRSTAEIPIIMLTARGEESDQIAGYRVGADDYVSKPFSVRILLERIRLLLKNKSRPATATNLPDPESSGDVVSRSGLTIDRVRHRVTLKGQPLELTPTEFRMLDTLIRQPGRVFERSDLIDSALGSDTIVQDRTIDVHIRSLRKKLGDSADVIQTVRGFGYRFAETPEASE